MFSKHVFKMKNNKKKNFLKICYQKLPELTHDRKYPASPYLFFLANRFLSDSYSTVTTSTPKCKYYYTLDFLLVMDNY